MNELNNITAEGKPVEANKNTTERKKNKPKVSIIFKSILGIVALLIVFSIIVSIIGFRNFTGALLEQYAGECRR